MKTRLKAAAAAVLVAGSLGAGSARAQGIPVIDIANLIQTILQVLNDVTEISNQVQQITQLQDQLNSINGIRNLGNVFNNPLLKNYVPAEAYTYVNAINTSGYAGLNATAKALRGGWFHTGDLGRLDARGLLYITGRESDMYISGGSNVYPRECEDLLLEHPGVAEVAVLGVPERSWGEVGVAVVVRRPGFEALDGEALLAHLDGKLARYRWPRQFVFWEALPKSGYGKITKKDVRALLIERGDVQLPEGTA